MGRRRNNKNRPGGSGTVSHARRQKFQEKGEERRLAREAAEAEAARAQETAEQAEPEEKPKEKKQKTNEVKKEVKAEGSASSSAPALDKSAKDPALDKSAKATALDESAKAPALAKSAETAALDESAGSTDQAKALDKSATQAALDESAKEAAFDDSSKPSKMEVESSDDSLDKRESRNKQQSRGTSANLQLGPSSRQEQIERKRASSSKAKERTWVRKQPTKDVVIDFSTLEKEGNVMIHIAKALECLSSHGFNLHLVKRCNERQWADIRAEATIIFRNWATLTRFETHIGPEGKFEFMRDQGFSILFDCSFEALLECVQNCMRVYPIQVGSMKHEWNKKFVKKGTTFSWKSLDIAIDYFLDMQGLEVTNYGTTS